MTEDCFSELRISLFFLLNLEANTYIAQISVKKKRNESYTTKMTRIQPYFVVHLNQTCVMTN